MATFMKCPACGAPVDPLALKCPECGYVFSHEFESSKVIREEFQALQTSLVQTQNPEKKAAIISAFSTPVTVDGLLNMLVYAYSNFERCNGLDDEKVSSAWLEKAKQAYQTLKIKANSDKDILSKIKGYVFLEDTKTIPKVKISKTSKRKRSIFRWCIILGILLIAVYLFLLVISNMDEPNSSDVEIRQEVMGLIQQGRYDQARVKAAESEYSWERGELLEIIEKEENEKGLHNYNPE